MSKHIGLCISLLCLFSLGFGQGSLTLEYFFDTDPGFGQGIQVSMDTEEMSLGVDLTNLSPGIHTLYTRVYDSETQTWSQTVKRNFYTSTIPDEDYIERIDYYFQFDTIQTEVQSLTLLQSTLEVDVEFSPELSNLPGSGNYQLCVQAVTVDGTQSIPICQSITLGGLSTSAKSSLAPYIKVYPTLTQEMIFLEVETTVIPNYQVQILDVQGRIHQQWKAHQQKQLEIPVSGLANGVYFILVETQGRIFVEGFEKSENP